MPGFHFMGAQDDDFPSPALLTSDLGVIGSNLNPTTLIKAYKKGYFPWYNKGEPRCWFHPDPRMVLFPGDLIVHKSMRPLLNGNKFSFSINTNFTGVMMACRNVKRTTGGGRSWITEEFIASYSELFRQGYACSAETRYNGELVGGLYGLKIGNVFFGESMFSSMSNASKFAFIRFVEVLKSQGIVLIDCQQETAHMASLGARPISRRRFVQLLEKLIPENEHVW